MSQTIVAPLRSLTKKNSLVLNLIWGAFTMLCILYSFLALMLASNKEISIETLNGSLNSPIVYPLIATALIMMALSFTAPSFLLKIMLLKSKDKAEITQFMQTKKDRYGRKTFSDGEVQAGDFLTYEDFYCLAMFRSWLICSIVRYALVESITLLGFIITLQTHCFVAILPFCLLSLSLFISSRPTFEGFRETVMNASEGKR